MTDLQNYCEAARLALEIVQDEVHKHASSRPESATVGQVAGSVHQICGEIDEVQRSTALTTQKLVSTSLITLDETLSRHDQALAKAEKYQPQPDSQAPSNEQIQELLKCLELTMADTIQTRLESKALQSLVAVQHQQAGPYSMSGRVADQEYCELIRQDLSTLLTEVPSVVSMLVEEEHRHAISLASVEADKHQHALSFCRRREVLSTTKEMTQALEDMASYAEALQSYRKLLHNLESCYRSAQRSGSNAGDGTMPDMAISRPNRTLSRSTELLRHFGPSGTQQTPEKGMKNIDDIISTLYSASKALDEQQAATADLLYQSDEEGSLLDKIEADIANVKGHLDSFAY